VRLLSWISSQLLRLPLAARAVAQSSLPWDQFGNAPIRVMLQSYGDMREPDRGVDSVGLGLDHNVGGCGGSVAPIGAEGKLFRSTAMQRSAAQRRLGPVSEEADESVAGVEAVDDRLDELVPKRGSRMLLAHRLYHFQWRDTNSSVSDTSPSCLRNAPSQHG
jgi:hypothetical protein